MSSLLNCPDADRVPKTKPDLKPQVMRWVMSQQAVEHAMTRHGVIDGDTYMLHVAVSRLTHAKFCRNSGQQLSHHRLTAAACVKSHSLEFLCAACIVGDHQDNAFCEIMHYSTPHIAFICVT